MLGEGAGVKAAGPDVRCGMRDRASESQKIDETDAGPGRVADAVAGRGGWDEGRAVAFVEGGDGRGGEGLELGEGEGVRGGDEAGDYEEVGSWGDGGRAHVDGLEEVLVGCDEGGEFMGWRRRPEVEACWGDAEAGFALEICGGGFCDGIGGAVEASCLGLRHRWV